MRIVLGLSWGIEGLFTEIYNSLGNELLLNRKLKKAIGCYERALCIFGQHERAHLNKLLNLLDKMRAERN